MQFVSVAPSSYLVAGSNRSQSNMLSVIWPLTEVGDL